MVMKGQDLHVCACVIQTQAHAGTWSEQTQVRNTHMHGHTESTHQVLYGELFLLLSPSGVLDCTGFQGSVRGGGEGY